jgi:hypothetical protein
MGHDNSTTAPESVLFSALAAAAVTPGYQVMLDQFEAAFQKRNIPSICLVPEEVSYERPPTIKDGQSCAGELLSITAVLWAPTYDALRELRGFFRTVTTATFMGFAEFERFSYTKACTDTYGRSGEWEIKIRTDLPLYNSNLGSARIDYLLQTAGALNTAGNDE